MKFRGGLEMKKIKGYVPDSKHVYGEPGLEDTLYNYVEGAFSLARNDIQYEIDNKIKQLEEDGFVLLFDSASLPDPVEILKNYPQAFEDLFGRVLSVFDKYFYADLRRAFVNKVNQELISQVKALYPHAIVSDEIIYLPRKELVQELDQIKVLHKMLEGFLKEKSQELKEAYVGKGKKYLTDIANNVKSAILSEPGFSLREETAWEFYTQEEWYKILKVRRLDIEFWVQIFVELENNLIKNIDIDLLFVYKVDDSGKQIELWNLEHGWRDNIEQDTFYPRKISSSHTKLNEKGDHLFNLFLFVLQKQIHDSICNYDLGEAIADYLNKNYSFEIDNQQGIIVFDEEGDFFIVNPSGEILYEFDLDLDNCYEVIGDFVKSLNFIFILTSFLSKKGIDFNEANDIDLEELVKDFCSWVKNQEELIREIQQGIIEEFSHALLNELIIEDE